jgi:hypothetical protein
MPEAPFQCMAVKLSSKHGAVRFAVTALTLRAPRRAGGRAGAPVVAAAQTCGLCDLHHSESPVHRARLLQPSSARRKASWPASAHRPSAREAVQNGHGFYRQRVLSKVEATSRRKPRPFQGRGRQFPSGEMEKVQARDVSTRARCCMGRPNPLKTPAFMWMAKTHSFVITGPAEDQLANDRSVESMGVNESGHAKGGLRRHVGVSSSSLRRRCSTRSVKRTRPLTSTARPSSDPS